jgi:hypothetical protein
MNRHCVKAALLVCLIFGTHGFAQVGINATLSGTVSDASGALIPGVEVAARHTGTGVVLTALTNESGTYRFPSLQPGSYETSATLTGFQTQTFRLTLGTAQQRSAACCPATSPWRRSGYQISHLLPGNSLSWIDADLGVLPGLQYSASDLGDGTTYRDFSNIIVPLPIPLTPESPVTIPLEHRSMGRTFFDPNYTTPYIQTLTLGITRSLTSRHDHGCPLRRHARC